MNALASVGVDMDSDASLVHQTLAGHTEAFGALVERYSGLVHALILERVRRRDEVEDLVQEVFCAAYTGLGSLLRPARFASWLAGIAAHTALTWVRREGVRSRGEEIEADWTGPTLSLPDEDLERSEEARVLWAALDRLPDEQRRLVVLYHCHGCTYRELARFLDTPLATIRWRLRRAERQLGSAMAEALGVSIQAQEPDRPALRRRILAALPLSLPLATPSQSTLMSWLGGKGILALLGAWPVGVVIIGVLSAVGTFYWLRPSTQGKDDGLPRTDCTAAYQPQPTIRLTLAPAPNNPDSSAWEPPPRPPDATHLRELASADAVDTTEAVVETGAHSLTAKSVAADSGWSKKGPPESGKPAWRSTDDPTPLPDKGAPVWEGEYEGTGDYWARPDPQVRSSEDDFSLSKYPKQPYHLRIAPVAADTLRVYVRVGKMPWNKLCFLAVKPQHRTWEGEVASSWRDPRPEPCGYGLEHCSGECRTRYSLTWSDDRIDGEVRYFEKKPVLKETDMDAPQLPTQIMIFTVYRASTP